MQSIYRLWACCAEKRVSDKPVNDRIRHYLAILVTWGLVKTPLTANIVTVLFLVVGAVGGIALAGSGYWIPLIGALILQLHAVLDIADGQVARYRRWANARPGNPKKGMYLDLVGHVVTDTLIFTGLALSFNDSVIASPWVFVLALLGSAARILYLLIGCVVAYVVCTESPADSDLRVPEIPTLKSLKRDLVSGEAGTRGVRDLIIGAFFIVRWPHYLDFILIMAIVGRVEWTFPILAFGTLIFTAGSVCTLVNHRIISCPPGEEREALRK
jgi:phosphatidylglycerophosphate synthase